MKNLICTFLVLHAIIPLITCQSVTMIQDINPGSSSSITTAYTPTTVINDILLFTANDGTHGNEVWTFDGFSTQLLKDINVGAGGVDVEEFIHFAGKVFFVVDDGVHGDEWWITDGTESGTQLFMDLNPGEDDGVTFSEHHHQYIIYQTELFFAGADDKNNFELWKTDGTSSGTVLVKNISHDNSSFNVGSHPQWFIILNGELLFATRDGLFKSDGTGEGTILVREDDPFDIFGFDPSDLINMGDYALMYTYERLWRSDGTYEGTYPVDSFGHAIVEGDNDRIVKIGDLALFPASDPVHGDEMWVTDGTAEGTHILKDIYPGTEGYAYGTIITYKGIPHFKAEDAETGIELWKSDGTETGTTRVTDIADGDESSFFWPTTIYTDNELIYMGAGRAFRTELWISDGTASGTFEIDLNPSGESLPNSMIRYKNFLFFGARSDNSLGFEPHILDLTTYLSTDEVNDNIHLVSVFPNPARDRITVDWNVLDGSSAAIYDMYGRRAIVLPPQLTNSIDVSSLPSGQYFLHVFDEKLKNKALTSFSVIK